MTRTNTGPARRVTRSDVARYAGVSTAVVSYVLNNGPRPVAEATAARVREAMDILQYRPNLSARALRVGTTQTLGLVLADSLNPFFVELTSALEKAAAARGHRLLVADSRGSATEELELIEDLLSRQVSGLILVSTFQYQDPMSRIRSSYGIPSIVVDGHAPLAGRMTLGADAFAGARILTEHLVTVHGHSDIGLVTSEGTDPREQGWAHTLRGAGLHTGPIARVPWSREGGYDAGRQFLADRVPAAIVASSDQMAIGVLLALREAGLDVPRDVALVSYDGTKEAEFCWPPLTVASQPTLAMAARVIDLLENPEEVATHHVFQPDLIVRSSCGCPPHRRLP